MIVTAPGKLMIAGEYSVLGPAGEALALAVKPGLEVEARPADRWQVHRADSDATWTEGEPVPDDLRFAVAALRAARGDSGALDLCTRVLGGTGTGTRKPGIGGSAAVTVAVTAAVLRRCDPEPVTRFAVQTHIEAQGGRGSGYDVATIAHGGLVRWRPTQVAGQGGAVSGEARRIAWPNGLHVLAGYTGQSASTTGLIGRMEAVALTDRAAAVRDLAALGRPVGALVDAFEAGDVPEILTGIRACHEALVRWDRIGVVTGAVDAMIGLADSAGARAKVSGAGGGDSVLAFADDEGILERVSAAWSDAGFVPLPFEIDTLGVREKNE